MASPRISAATGPGARVTSHFPADITSSEVISTEREDSAMDALDSVKPRVSPADLNSPVQQYAIEHAGATHPPTQVFAQPDSHAASDEVPLASSFATANRTSAVETQPRERAAQYGAQYLTSTVLRVEVAMRVRWDAQSRKKAVFKDPCVCLLFRCKLSSLLSGRTLTRRASTADCARQAE